MYIFIVGKELKEYWGLGNVGKVGIYEIRICYGC